jgi:hypothetical protein
MMYGECVLTQEMPSAILRLLGSVYPPGKLWKSGVDCHDEGDNKSMTMTEGANAYVEHGTVLA